MKIVTIGMSPYNLVSHGKVHSWVLKYLYLKGHSVSSIVWAHDISYYVPEMNKEKPVFYYTFEHGGASHKIPISPFNRNANEAVGIYEILKALEPDLVVTVGEITDFLFMKAVKTFYTGDFKWMFVLMNYQIPVHEDNQEIMDYVDGVLCTSPSSCTAVFDLFKNDLIDTSYVGVNRSIYHLKDRAALRSARNLDGKFRVMASGKNLQSDNLPMLMQAVADARKEDPSIELYLHANVYDDGEYDLETVRKRLDPQEEFIIFPKKYVSLSDGPPQEELADELNSADLFVSVPMVSATSISVLEAMACGCRPLMSDCGSNTNIAERFEEHSKGKITRKELTVDCISLMTVGESYLRICDPKELKDKILEAVKKRRNHEGDRESFSEFTREYGQDVFLKKISNMVERLENSNRTICLETVQGEEPNGMH